MSRHRIQPPAPDNRPVSWVEISAVCLVPALVLVVGVVQRDLPLSLAGLGGLAGALLILVAILRSALASAYAREDEVLASVPGVERSR